MAGSDVVALGRLSDPRARGAQVTMLGEAKATNRFRDTADLRRLEHIRDLLAAGDSGQVTLLDLPTMYGVSGG